MSLLQDFWIVRGKIWLKKFYVSESYCGTCHADILTACACDSGYHALFCSKIILHLQWFKFREALKTDYFMKMSQFLPSSNSDKKINFKASLLLSSIIVDQKIFDSVINKTNKFLTSIYSQTCTRCFASLVRVNWSLKATNWTSEEVIKCQTSYSYQQREYIYI